MKDTIYGDFEEHVKPGDKVWWSGDMIDDPKIIIVGPSYHSEEWRNGARKKGHCYEEVNLFWNRLYYDNQKAAETENRQYRAGFYDRFSTRW